MEIEPDGPICLYGLNYEITDYLKRYPFYKVYNSNIYFHSYSILVAWK